MGKQFLFNGHALTTRMAKQQISNREAVAKSRLYIDRLAHWRPSLVDIILKFEPLAEVPKAISE